MLKVGLLAFLLLASSVAAAQSAPRVGLVLSGGGARGAAHVGVLKVLEEQRIPIHAIAGTSMGAVVGGLYASGLSAGEITALIESDEWRAAFTEPAPRDRLSFRRKSEDQNFLVKFPLGIKSGSFRLPKGLVSGQRVSQALRRVTFPVAGRAQFDQLPIPFRAVATDLETGDAVVLGSGDLVDAMRASLAAPGVFAPVEIDGRLLVDGGLANNLPVDVAQAMGVDVLIVVDVGFPLRKRDTLDSVTTISNQMLSILIRRGSDAQRERLGTRDILISPDLGEASSFDFAIVPQATSLGESAARAAATQLASLSMDVAGYAAWLADRAAAREQSPQIRQVRIADSAIRYRRLIEGRFAGATLDTKGIDGAVSTLFGRGNFESVDYRVQGESRDTLEVAARRNSWGPNYVRFGLSLQDDFNGNSTYNAAARFVLADIGSLAAEWVWDVQVGVEPRIATEAHIPFGDEARWFWMPQASFELRNVPLVRGGERIAEYRLRTSEYGLDVGRELSNWGEVRAGVRQATGRARLRLGDPSLATSDAFDVREYFGRFSIDTLDDRNFPRRGQYLVTEWRGERTGLGSDRNADIVTLDWLSARSRGRDTFAFWTSFGTQIDSAADNVRTLFPLGGFLNLSGIAPETLSGRHFAIARALYYRQIGRGGEGFLNVPAYAGLSVEAGNVWDDRSEISLASSLKQGSLFFGFDTLFGPVYIGTGFGENSDSSFYLFLGRTF
ncbi:MAG: patatin-like phospholipase family protein [Steroidobacteraceae bacterium]